LGIRTKKIYTKIYMSRRSKKLASASNLQWYELPRGTPR
jgi:hypothetical protein